MFGISKNYIGESFYYYFVLVGVCLFIYYSPKKC